MNINFDIIIVGSGLTGNSCSLALAKAGYSIALIDPLPFTKTYKDNHDTRTTALSSKARLFFEEINKEGVIPSPPTIFEATSEFKLETPISKSK